MTDLDGGYMYCCSLEEAAAVFDEISSLNLPQPTGLVQAPGEIPTTPAPTSAPAACSVQLDNLSGKYPPMLTQNSDFKYPTSEEADGSRLLKFDEDEQLDLYCHGSLRYQETTTVVDGDGVDTGASKLSLKCSEGQFLNLQTLTPVSVETATCSRKQEARLVRDNQVCSDVGADGRLNDLSQLVRVSIGWQIEENFIEQIGICHDEKLYSTIWSNYTLHGVNIDFRDKDPARPSFRIDTSYNKRFFTWTTSTGMNNYYSKNNQVEESTKVLGTNSLGGVQIIENSASGTNYFAKGHLSPDAAFIYNLEQDATYYFINVAPQFQSFNNGNWKALEMAVRDLGTKFGRDLVVTTGTHEVLEYPDKSNSPTDIYLARIESYVPAPKYYWKVVQDPETKTGAAFIGLNDPHTNVAPVELCKNRCSEMSSWVDR